MLPVTCSKKFTLLVHIAAGDRNVSNSNSSIEKNIRNDLPTKKEKHYLLVVMVLSAPSEKGKIWRQVIRETWKNEVEAVKSEVFFKFVLGTVGLAQSQLLSLESEQKNHSDLLLLGSFKDDYHNLTRKVLNMLVWANNHLHFSYLLKSDQDTYVRLKSVVSELNGRKSNKSLYWGYFTSQNSPTPTGKFAERNWFLCNHFLPFAQGGGYIISSDLVHLIARNAGNVQLYNNEDSSLALWLSPYKIERKHDPLFNIYAWARGCSNKHLLSGEQSVADVRSKYQMLLRSGGKQQCTVEKRRSYGYKYNWHVPPSRCCREKYTDD